MTLHKALVNDVCIDAQEIQNVLERRAQYFQTLQTIKIKTTWRIRWFRLVCRLLYFFKKEVPMAWQMHAIGGCSKSYTVVIKKLPQNGTD